MQLCLGHLNRKGIALWRKKVIVPGLNEEKPIREIQALIKELKQSLLVLQGEKQPMSREEAYKILKSIYANKKYRRKLTQ